MSLLTAALMSAALLGADPGIVSQVAPACSTEWSDGYSVDNSHCQSGGHSWCPWCHSDNGECEEPCCFDRHLLTYCIGPGDLYPHYPYYPIQHGYYYFRPYNHMHVEEASALAAQMGGDPKAPYSVEFLYKYFPPRRWKTSLSPKKNPIRGLKTCSNPKCFWNNRPARSNANAKSRLKMRRLFWIGRERYEAGF